MRELLELDLQGKTAVVVLNIIFYDMILREAPVFNHIQSLPKQSKNPRRRQYIVRS